MSSSAPQTHKFDIALGLSMFTGYVAVCINVYIGLIETSPASSVIPTIILALLLGFFVTIGTLIAALWAGILKLLCRWFQKPHDPWWVIPVMPILSFILVGVPLYLFWSLY